MRFFCCAQSPGVTLGVTALSAFFGILFLAQENGSMNKEIAQTTGIICFAISLFTFGYALGSYNRGRADMEELPYERNPCIRGTSFNNS